MFPPQKDTQLELLYPIHTSVKDIHKSNRRLRRVIVYSARDLVAEPLTPAEFIRRPYVSRSRWLIRAWDIDQKSWRNFYLGSSTQFQSPGTLGIAEYNPETGRLLRLLSRQFEPCVHDRRVILRLIARIVARDEIPQESLRIIASDFRLHA